MKSELAIKRDEWFDSEEGQKCSGPFSLVPGREGGKYLHNRLELAFLAGVKAEHEVDDEMRTIYPGGY